MIVRNRNNTKRGAKKDKAPKEVRAIETARPSRNSWGVMRVVRFPGFGFPDQLRICLRYQEDIIFQTVNEPNQQAFDISSIFDPNATGTGHQPEFYDQLAQLYNKYCVTGAQVTAQVANLAASTTHLVAACYCEANTTMATQSIAEHPYGMSKTVSTSGAGSVTLELPPISIARLQGQSEIRSDPSVYSTMSSNPTDSSFYIFRAAALNGGTCFLSVQFNIIYDVTLKDLVNQVPSLVKQQADSTRKSKR